jgi:hypothetical protein
VPSGLAQGKQHHDNRKPYIYIGQDLEHEVEYKEAPVTAKMASFTADFKKKRGA